MVATAVELATSVVERMDVTCGTGLLADRLADVPLFSGLSAESRERLAAFAFQSCFEPGELIVQEGRTPNGLYVVMSGSVEILKGIDSDRPRVVATLGVGEPLGEMEVLAEWPRTASARAVERTEVVGLDSWVFMDFLHDEPQMAIRLLQILSKRLAETSERVAY
jgi:CRP-like cAMP-binding protein